MAEGAGIYVMRLGGAPDLGHLTYCTNIHAGEDWQEVDAALREHLPEIKAAFSPENAMGIGLRLSATAARGLSNPETMARFHQFLADGNYYVFTLNGFPYGTFHGGRVKEEAYRPDWSEADRLTYTNQLAQLLAELLDENMAGSISTVPGTFGPWAGGRIDAIVDNLIAHVAYLVELQGRTGTTIELALEPEPRCLLETIAETAAFFDERLFAPSAEARLADLTGLTRGEAATALRRHLGVCYDVCHAAVEFEDPQASIALLQNAGIRIGKLQLSAALRVMGIDDNKKSQLQPFDEPVYLHQVVANRNGHMSRYLDLPEALAQGVTGESVEWRIHFHVPIFLEQMKMFSTTQDFLREILAIHRETPISEHLEVETYTWDVLPEQYRNVSIGAAIARELNWTRDRLVS